MTENFYQEAPSWSPNGRVLYYRTKAGSKGEGFSASLWSIDITGYMRENLRLKQMPQTHLGPLYYQSKGIFNVIMLLILII